MLSSQINGRDDQDKAQNTMLPTPSSAPELRRPPQTTISNPIKTFSFHMPISLLSPISSHFSLNLTHHLQASSRPISLVDDLEFEPEDGQDWEFGAEAQEPFDPDFDFGSDSKEVRVRDLEEVPEEWRRARLAWLCKNLPSHRSATFSRILGSNRKWMRQDDATYVAVHCLRVREGDSGFRVYKWMMQQQWYQFDFALATKLADHMGKERKFSKCREIFDDILNRGSVPCESTFQILIDSYLSAPNQGCLEEACTVYNQMVQLGGYQPQLTLHNSLFRALVSKPGSFSKQYLKQAEFVYQNLATSGLEIQKDIYAGLIWLHSFQDIVDKERITSLREAMQKSGFQEGRDVLLSVLRACSKEGNVEEAERTWLKLRHTDGGTIPPQAFVYKMEAYAKVRQPMKSLEIFEELQKSGSTTDAAYHKIIEILCKVREIEHAESIMEKFVRTGNKSLSRSFIDMMNMYFDMSLHDKLESAFSLSLEKCRPDRTIYNIYLDSLVKIGNVEKIEEIFNEMRSNVAIGVNAQSCNTVLDGFLSCEDSFKAVKMYLFMCEKKFDIATQLMEKLDPILSALKRPLIKSESPKLRKEQREMLVGFLLGGMEIESDARRKNHVIRFEFKEDASALRTHIYDQFHEWIHSSSKPVEGSDAIPYIFYTIPHTNFGFYADQFRPKGNPTIPNLIHRWLTPCALAYWYMYSGQRTPSGDIVLKLKGDREGIAKIVKALGANSLDCKVKRKGGVYWIGFLDSNAARFWELIEPFVLNGTKDISSAAQIEEGENETDSDQNLSDYSDKDDR